MCTGPRALEIRLRPPPLPQVCLFSVKWSFCLYSSVSVHVLHASSRGPPLTTILLILVTYCYYYGGDGLSGLPYPGSSSGDWEVTVVTGDKRGAGTDANVSITFFGSKATSFKTPLKTKLEVRQGPMSRDCMLLAF